MPCGLAAALDELLPPPPLLVEMGGECMLCGKQPDENSSSKEGEWELT